LIDEERPVAAARLGVVRVPGGVSDDELAQRHAPLAY